MRPVRGGEIERPPQTAAHRDLLDHPDFMERLNRGRGGTAWFRREAVPCCTGPVAYTNRAPLETDLQNLAAACAAVKSEEAFMNAASPGVLTNSCRTSFTGMKTLTSTRWPMP